MQWGTGLGVNMDLDRWNEISEDIQRVSVENTGRRFQSDLDKVGSKTLTQGASTTLVAALDPALPGLSPAYLADCRIQEPYEYALDPEGAEKLWRISEELVGQRFDY